MLEEQGVFFSHPVDLDLMMMTTFPAAYDVTSADRIEPDQEIVVAVLGKSHVNEDRLPDDARVLFGADHDRFDLGSKPSAHLGALAVLTGSRVQRVVDRPGRRPALPRQPRHTYAAVLRCGLPTGLAHPASELIPPEAGSHTAHRPISARFEPAPDLRGVHHWFARTTPSGLARRARAVWQSQHDPALSGLLPPAPASPGPGFPQLQSGRCDGPMVKASHLHTTTHRFTAHYEHQVGESKGHGGRSCWAACEL